MRLFPGSLTATLVTLTLLTISNSFGNVVLNVTPNGFPAVRLTAKRDVGDDGPVSYVQVCRN